MQSNQQQTTMDTAPVDALIHIKQDIDRKALKALTARLREQHKRRRQKAFEQLSPLQRQAMQVLPLLIHSGHAALPGYVAHVATGIDHYKPDELTLRAIKKITLSYTPPRLVEQDSFIESLFLMGSSGTLGHGRNSDADLWVCCKKHHHKLLEQKMSLIQKWAKTYKLELHYFLVDPEDFRLGNQISSTQTPCLVLDEFYRSATLLEGRFPAWWLVPPGTGTDYDAYVERLLKQRFVGADAVIDFGHVAKIPMDECFNAGLTELERAFDTPHKSLLKLVLIESYATDQNHSTLSEDYKGEMQSDSVDLESLDTYLLLYKRVDAFLSSISEPVRLRTLRSCFAAKITDGSAAQTKEIDELMETLMEPWGWQGADFDHVKNRDQWSIEARSSENRNITREHRQAYRWVSKLAERNPLIAPEAIDRLTSIRLKLDLADLDSGSRVPRINPVLLPKSSSEKLTIRALENAWCVLSNRKRVFESEQLTLIVIWFLQNGLGFKNVSLEGAQESMNIERLFTAIAQLVYPYPIPDAVDSTPDKLLVLLNANQNLVPDIEDQAGTIISNWNDPLCFSGFKQNLVRDIELVQIDRSMQISLRQLDNNSALEDLLSHSLNTPYQTTTCFCVDPQKATLISKRVNELLTSTSFKKLSSEGIARYIFGVAKKLVCIDINAGISKVRVHANEEALFVHLAKPPASSHATRGSLTRVDPQCDRLSRFRAFSERVDGKRAAVLVDDYHGTVSLYAAASNGAIYRPEIAQRPAKQLAHSISTFIKNLLGQGIEAPLLLINKNAGVDAEPMRYVPPKVKIRPGLKVKKYTALDETYDFTWGEAKWLNVSLDRKVAGEIADYAASVRDRSQPPNHSQAYPIHISDICLDQPQNNFVVYFLLKLHLEAVFARFLDQ